MLGSSSLALSFNLCGRGDCSFLSVVGKVKVFLKTGAIPTDLRGCLQPRGISIHYSLGLAAKRRRTAVEKQEILGSKHYHCKLYITGE